MKGSEEAPRQQEVGNVALDLRCQGFADALDGNSRVIATSNDPTVRPAWRPMRQHPEMTWC
jgi:simple sugar transport system substrate-binding protein